MSFSDSLDNLVFDGAKLGGLSSLAYDPRSAAYVSAVDNNGTDPARIWLFRNLSNPKVIRDPLVLRKQLVANLVDCPTLGAPSRDYEGMDITSGGPDLATVSMISDDNFSATQFTRVLNLIAKLP